MIETAQALDNLDDILSVEGLDAIYIGPSDLSLSLGCTPTMDDLDPKAAQAIDHILARAKAHGVVAGIHNASARGGAQAHRQGIPVRHRQLRCAADGGRRAAGDGEDARSARRRQPAHRRLLIILQRKGTAMKIGFIGLGIMGAPMALHLVAAGHELFVSTRSKVPESIAAPRPGRAPPAPRCARNAEVVFIDGARHARRRAVLFGKDGVASGCRPAAARARSSST